VIGVIVIYRLTFFHLEHVVLRHYVIFLSLLWVSLNSAAFGSFLLKFSSIELEGISAKNVEIQFAWIDTEHIDLVLDAEYIDTIFPGEFKDAQVNCRGAYFNGETIICKQGELFAQHPDLGRLQGSLQFTYNRQQGLLKLSMQSSLVSASVVTLSLNQTAQGLQTVLQLKDMEVTYFQRLLEQYAILPDHVLTTGILDATVNLNSHEALAIEIDADMRLSDLGVDGENILEGVAITSHIAAQRKGKTWEIINNTQLLQGAMYITPNIEVLNDQPGFYLEVIDKPVSIQADLQWQTEEKRLKVNELIFEHPEHVILQLKTNVVFQEALLTESLSIDIRMPDLEKTFPVYIAPLLLQTNFNDMEAFGVVDLNIAYNNNVLEQFALKMNDVFVDDKSARYSLSGITADIFLSDQTEPIKSELYWQGVSLYRIDFGSGNIKFESKGKNIRIIDWQDVDILDGTLLINGLSLNNVGTADFELMLDGNLSGVSMQTFSHVMGWPLFKGKLSSAVSGFKYSHNSVQIDGDILVQAFNGEVVLKRLRIDDIFSDFSSLTTDITVNTLDLEQLTDTFSFGKIEGNLSGKMTGLKLEDWQPVYFEAEFATPEDDEKPHRISQKALENLNQIGGGLSGTLSNGFLRFFPTYSYGRVGISCRLYKGICELGGVENTPEGFYILTRGGLLPPWVEVKGTGRSIVWKHLIGGLKRISEGDVSLE
jgi:hypothetical protein